MYSLKNLHKHQAVTLVLFFLAFSFLWNCQKEDDNQTINPDQDKNKSISQTSLNDILNQNSLSNETFGLMSKNQKTSSKKSTSEPTFKLTSSKGLKYEDNGNTYHVFLMKRTDKTDGYYYNLVVHNHDGKLDKYIYKYPLDKTEYISVSKITDDNYDIQGKSSYSKSVPVTVKNDLGDGCTETYFYDVTPCPCVGHIEPAICYCDIQPVWVYKGGPYYYCPAPATNNPTIEQPDNDDDPDIGNGLSISDILGCVRNSNGMTECPPDDGPEAIPFIPYTPLPTLEPDFDLDNGNSFLLAQLDLTDLQRDWLEKIENSWAKIKIEDYLSQYVLTTQFNDAKIFAVSAIEAFMSYTESNYPGLSKGFPYQWWKDVSFIINSGNFDIDDEAPNAKEAALFAIFTSQAISHIENSTVALDKAYELANNGTFTPSSIVDGKADAFRHAFWNALGTAEFGSFVMKLFADAHEWGEAPSDSVTMDFYNNNHGRIVGGDFNFLSNDSVISTAILQALYDGKLK